MRPRPLVTALAVAAVAIGCSSSSDRDVQQDLEGFFRDVDPGRADEITAELDDVLAAPSTEGLGPDEAFCTVYASVRPDWIEGAIVPLGVWIERTAAAAEVVPQSLEAPLADLRAFADEMWEWNFEASGGRPKWSQDLEEAERTIAEWAVANCELPDVLGSVDGTDPWPPWLEDESAATVAVWCDEQVARVAEAQAGFRELTGSFAPHPLLLETHTDTYYAHQGAHRIVDADADGYELRAVPDGPCA